MSQAGLLTSSSGGAIPPTVPEIIGVDYQIDGVTQPGLVTPFAHKFYILGTTGIITQADTTDAANDTCYILFKNGHTITSDGAGQTQTVLTFTVDNNTGFTANVLLTAYESSTNLSYGGRLCLIAKNVGGTCSIITELENINGGEAPLDQATFTSVGSGNQVLINVTGVAGHIMDWTAITPGVIGGPLF